MNWNPSRMYQRTEFAPFLLVFVVALVTGCGDATVTAPVTQQSNSAIPTTDSRAESTPAVKPRVTQAETSANASETTSKTNRTLVHEVWDVVMMKDTKVGYSHFAEYASTLDDQPVREFVSESEISMQRFGETMTQEFDLTSIETTDGQVLRFAIKIKSPPSEISMEGSYNDGTMQLSTTTAGETQTSVLSWNPSTRGFFADQQMLKTPPIQPGQKRRITALNPATMQPSLVTLVAQDREMIDLLGESRQLLKVGSTVDVGGTQIKTIFWVDESGEVLKSVVPSLNHETFRTTKEVALAPVGVPDFDIGSQTVVKLKQPIEKPHSTKRVVYRTRLANSSPAETFANCRSQVVKAIDENSAEIVVTAIRPNSRVVESNASVPTDNDLKPNSLIQCDDGAIVSLAERVSDGETDSWNLATKFESYVNGYVHKKDFSQAIASASDVVRSQQGDCTEHAVLLAALCRAKKIPARVAIGLVYYSPVQGFAYHMWNEVWIDNGWVPLDATLGKGGIGAGHLKIADSDLATASPITALLPVVEVIGQLELEVVSVE